VIVNQEAADRYWPGAEPVGQTMRFVRGADTLAAAVVGIVANARLYGLDTRFRPEVYLPVAQHPEVWVNFVIRGAGTISSLGAEAASRLAAIDREISRPQVTTLAQITSEAVAIPRFYLLVMGALGVLGLVLCVVGVYSVLAYLVATRRGERGIRLALGATPGELRRGVVMDLATPVLVGLGVGTLLGVAQSGLLQNLLFEIKPQDPLVFAAVPLGLLGLAVLTALIPAHHASRTDPAIVLRSD
jgi:hypothetical protein